MPSVTRPEAVTPQVRPVEATAPDHRPAIVKTGFLGAGSAAGAIVTIVLGASTSPGLARAAVVAIAGVFTVALLVAAVAVWRR